jgi:hypothetical protein
MFMPAQSVFPDYVKGKRHLGSLPPAMALAFVLSACSAQPQGQQVSTAPPPSAVQSSEQCSLLGVMACRAVSFVSGDAAAERGSTCIVSRVSGGSRVETCGSAQVQAQTPVPSTPTGNFHPVHLSWADNSNNENDFVIERCDRINPTGAGPNTASCAGGWRPIGSVSSNTTTYVDRTTQKNQTYIYRVKATNSAGSSKYTDEVSITTPQQ